MCSIVKVEELVPRAQHLVFVIWGGKQKKKTTTGKKTTKEKKKKKEKEKLSHLVLSRLQWLKLKSFSWLNFEREK